MQLVTHAGRHLLLICTAFAIGACARSAAVPEPEPHVVRPGAPGGPSREASAATPGAGARHVPADAEFMRGMIMHHAQAILMTALVPERTENREIRLLARRIEASQQDEMLMMRQWLEDRDEAVPDPTSHDHHTGHMQMPGMLTAAELERLRQARGREFDRLFLELMIRHHEGALVMVDQLYATPGAGQEAVIDQFAGHVDSDQRIEIARMRRMLNELTGRGQ